jgi:hypothetical protein
MRSRRYGGNAPLFGPSQHYSEAQIERFAQLRPLRAMCTPAGCHGGDRCWVEQGPPAYCGDACVGCGAKPKETVARARALVREMA